MVGLVLYTGALAVNTRFGPEWNPVLWVLGVLAVLCILAMIQWWLGLAGIVAALCIYVLLVVE